MTGPEAVAAPPAPADTIAARAGRIRQGVEPAAGWIDACFGRIHAWEPVVHAWAALDAPAARSAARAIDATPVADRQGALCALPVGVKDVIDTAGMVTAYGSPIYDEHVPVADAACVVALKVAGAIVVGKTATAEFAGNHPPPTTNPHARDRTPGGSSSGSAAAVAAGMVLAALGTQTAGSIIRPASYCGVVGYKPTFGTVGRAGMRPLSEETDTIGVFARTPADAGLVVAEMSGWPELADPPALPDRPVRVALCRTPLWDEAEPSTRTALAEAARRLEAAGAVVRPVELPEPCAGLPAAAMLIFIREVRAALAHELHTAPDRVSATLRGVLDLPHGDRADYHAALDLAARCRIRVEEAVFAHHDVILTPAAAGEAPFGLAATGSPAFNHLWSLLHVPCIAVPGLTGATGMPVGVQLVGPRRGDPALIAVAGWVQQVLSPVGEGR